ALVSRKLWLLNVGSVGLFRRNKLGGGPPMAVTLRFPPQGEFSMGVFSIVGVVRNTVFRSLRDGSEPAMYMPMAQRGSSTPYTTVFIGARTAAGDPVVCEKPAEGGYPDSGPSTLLRLDSLRPV